jgi:hypothetical protein
LKSKATELWENVIRLETEKYDLEERQKRQHWDVSKEWKTYNSALNLLAQRIVRTSNPEASP